MADWRDRAACRGMGPQLFFPEVGELHSAQTAKAVCSSCPVQADCLNEVLTMPRDWSQHGIWAGTSPKDRRGMRAERKPSRSVAACGTNAGYQRHRRADEQPCQACREAHNLVKVHLRAARRGEAA